MRLFAVEFQAVILRPLILIRYTADEHQASSLIFSIVV